VSILTTRLSLIEKEIISEINEAKLMEFNVEIAKEVRLSGSEEELRAFKYAQRMLESFGLITNLSFHHAYISLPGKAKLIAGYEEIPCITHSMAPSTIAEGLTGKPLYIGEFSPEKLGLCSGRIAVVEGIAAPAIIKELQNVGALGAIFINGPYTHEMIVSTVWGSPSQVNINEMPKIPVISVNDENGLNLRNQLDEGLEAVTIHTEVVTKWTPIPTLTAEIKGNEESDQFVLFSGHIDSWHFGAMDNGSANATMLETARVLSKYQKHFKRTLRFAFWSGHSHGRYAGSQAYADRHWEEIHENCVMHFYIDSVGGKGASILSESNCMAETKDIAAFYVKEIADQDYIGSRYGKYADQSFWGTGVPSLFMGMSEQPLSDDPMSQKVFKVFAGKKAGGFGWWWHTVEDTIDKIDSANLKRDCEVYVLSIYKVVSDPILPINQLAAVQEIKLIIENYQNLAGDKLDFELTLLRLNELDSLLKGSQMAKLDGVPEEVRKKVNKQIMALSRILVPLNYVGSDVFEHDPAIGLPPVPMLSSVQELSKLEKGTHEFHLLKTHTIRQINKTNYLIKQAVLEARKLTSTIEKGSGEHVSHS
jgi:hypothetical protein